MASCKDCAFDLACKNIGDWVGIRTPCSAYKDQARFLELPCLPGDEVFLISSYDNKISECTVFTMTMLISTNNRWFQLTLKNKRGAVLTDLHFSDIGKTIFLTREEAEKALKEREEMPDREMTPTEAIIILDRLNTEERIDVDRDELRAAIKVAKTALSRQIAVEEGAKV